MQPSQQPSGLPTTQPTRQPSGQPSRVPSTQPTSQPTRQPSSHPSSQPSHQPSSHPTNQPTQQPSRKPTLQPTSHPSRIPSSRPTRQPSNRPSARPTHPSGQPTAQPTSRPSRSSSLAPITGNLDATNYFTLGVSQTISGVSITDLSIPKTLNAFQTAIIRGVANSLNLAASGGSVSIPTVTAARRTLLQSGVNIQYTVTYPSGVLSPAVLSNALQSNIASGTCDEYQSSPTTTKNSLPFSCNH